MERLNDDPVLPVLVEKPDLTQVLEDLGIVWAKGDRKGNPLNG
jgi:hypothetical protein